MVKVLFGARCAILCLLWLFRLSHPRPIPGYSGLQYSGQTSMNSPRPSSPLRQRQPCLSLVTTRDHARASDPNLKPPRVRRVMTVVYKDKDLQG
jgi:hypothetical protein